MHKIVRYLFLALLLLTTGGTPLWAEETLPPKLQTLADEAYRSYSARDTKNFFEAIKRVKDATEFSDYQETYYRACSYEAIYMFEYVNRQKGVELSHAIYHHSKDNKAVSACISPPSLWVLSASSRATRDLPRKVSFKH